MLTDVERRVVDRAEAIALLERVVAERGADFMYKEQHCRYQYNGVPSCAVGLALSYLGVTVEQLMGLDYAGENTTFKSVHTLIDGFEFTPAAVAVLARFQFSQDHRAPYGGCLRDVKMGN